MTPQIFGRKTSSNVQVVMWGAAELGLAVERLDFGGVFGGTDTPAFRRMNPMGRVPVLKDADVTMFESQAILRYLAAKAVPTPLWPNAAIARAPVDQWMEWSKGTLFPAFNYKVFWQLVRTSATERDHTAVAAGIAEVKHLMQIASDQIARQGWLAGPQMSLADITFGTGLYRYFTLDIDRADLPDLASYYDRLTARAAYAEHVMVPYDALRHPDA
ncbi:MAG: glutathione S-transferase [Pseudomonadota bacterium]